MNKSAEEIAVHELKTWPEYFQAIKSGKKTFEVRKNDRSFKVGDVLLLKEWKPKGYSDVSPNELTGSYTGEELKVVVNYIMQTKSHEISSFGIPSNVVVMSISVSTKANREALGVEKPMKICLGNIIESMGNVELVTGIMQEEAGQFKVCHTGWNKGIGFIPDGIFYSTYAIPLTDEWKKCLSIEKYDKLPEWIQYVHEVQNYFRWALKIELLEIMDWKLLPQLNLEENDQRDRS